MERRVAIAIMAIATLCPGAAADAQRRGGHDTDLITGLVGAGRRGYVVLPRVTMRTPAPGGMRATIDVERLTNLTAGVSDLYGALVGVDLPLSAQGRVTMGPRVGSYARRNKFRRRTFGGAAGISLDGSISIVRRVALTAGTRAVYLVNLRDSYDDCLDCLQVPRNGVMMGFHVGIGVRW